MANKELQSRIIHKHDVAENWSKAENFIPKQGELIVYDTDSNYTYERFKIGDGVTLVNNLPFMPDPTDKMLVVTGTLNDGNTLTTDYTSEQIIAHIRNGGSTMLSLPSEELVLPLYMADCESTTNNPSTMVAYGGVAINKTEGCVQNRIFVVSGNTVVADNTPYEPDFTGYLKNGDAYTKTEIDEKVVDLTEAIEGVQTELDSKANKKLIVTGTISETDSTITTDYSSTEIIEYINGGGDTTLNLEGVGVLPFMGTENDAVIYGTTLVGSEGITVQSVMISVSGNTGTDITQTYDPAKAGFATTGNVYTKTEVDEKVVDLTEAIDDFAVGGHVWYGKTETAGDVVQKEVTTTTGDFVLSTGAVLFVEFTNTHTASTMSLKIDNGSSGAAFSADYTALKPNIVQRGEMACFVYNGNAFIMVRSQAATTSNYGVTKLNSAINSTSQTEAATPSAVKQAYDLANTANTAANNTYTKTVIDEKIVELNEAIDAADKVLVVTATVTTSDGVEYYTTDYSSTEIIEHINSGGITVLDVAGFMTLPCLQVSDNKVYYSQTIIDSQTVIGSLTLVVDGNTAGNQTMIYDPGIPAYSTTKPLMDGVEATGTAETISRGDHVHPTDTSRASQADLDALVTHVDEMYIKLDGIEEGAIARHVWYGTTSTAGSTAAKVVTTTSGDFVAKEGNIIFIMFNSKHTASSMQLNVDGIGAKSASYLFNGSSSLITSGMIAAKEIVGFVYNSGGYFTMLEGAIASTSQYGITKLSSAVDSTSTVLAATSSAVKKAYDLANAALPVAGGTMTGALTLAADPTTDLEAATKQYVDAHNAQVISATTEDGIAYTATVPGITALTAGVSFIMTPGATSASTTPTIDVNGLGAKNIRRRLSNLATATQNGYTATWLAVGLPFRLVYDGTQWIVEGHNKPVAADLYGTPAAATKATQDGDGNVITDTYATIAYVEELIGNILNGAS